MKQKSGNLGPNVISDYISKYNLYCIKHQKQFVGRGKFGRNLKRVHAIFKQHSMKYFDTSSYKALVHRYKKRLCYTAFLHCNLYENFKQQVYPFSRHYW